MQGCSNMTGKNSFLSKSTQFLTALIVTAMVPSVDALANSSHFPSNLKQLEVKTWTADETELDQIEHDLVRIIQVEPTSAYAHHLLSHLMVRMYSKNPGDMYLLKQASDLAQQSIDLDPSFDGGYASYAHLLDLMGNTDAGMKLLKDAEASGIEPNWRFYLTRARLTSDTTSTEVTLNLLRTALSFTDTQADIVVPYIIAIINTQKTQEAVISSLRDWQSKYPHDMFALALGLSYTENKQYKEAEAMYRHILSKKPEHLEAAVNLAVLQYKYLGEQVNAVDVLRDILAKRANKMTSATHNMVNLHLGAAYLRGKKFSDARAAFIATVSKDPANSGVLDFVTNAYRAENAHKELVGFLEGVTRDVAGVGIYYALMGETLSEQLGQHAAAVKSYQNAITLDPRRSDYYNGMGLAIYRGKDYRDALTAFNKATELDPSDATARYNEACMLSLLGETEEALSSLAEALTLNPRLTRSAANDDDFKNIRGSVKFRNLLADEEFPGLPLGQQPAIGH